MVELAVHMLLNTAFAVLTAEPVTAHFLNLIGITSKGYLYTYDLDDRGFARLPLY